MLSIFPSLLVFGIFAPFFLRLAVGIYLFYTGYEHLTKEQISLEKEFGNKLGGLGKSLAIIVPVFEILVGLSLVAGFLTQVMVLLGMVYSAKLLWFKKDCPRYAKHEKIFYVLVFIILLSLLFTGPGAFAVDLPL